MSWYAPGSGSGISVNPFVGVSNGSDGANTVASGSLTHTISREVGNIVDANVTQTLQDMTPDYHPGGLEEAENTLSQYMSEHPEATYEDILKYMSTQSEEWAEKYLDYLTERGEIDRANEYTASREDTAYQRLVEDLKKAGLNPAMMYGSSASISAGGSAGYSRMSEGANSREVSNRNKIQKLILAYMMYELQKTLGTANTVAKYIGAIGSFF